MNGGERAITIDEVPLEWCFQPGVKLDFRHLPDGYVVTPEDIEAEFARIGHTPQPLEIVVVNTAAGAAYGAPDYIDRGCGMGRDATLWLLERGVRVTGTDGWSWDAPFSHTRKRWLETHDPSIVWEGHRASMDIGYCHIEKLTNLDQLPRYRFSHLLLPIQDPRRLGRLRARRRHSRRLKPLDATRHPKRMTTLLRKHPMAKASRKVIMTCAVTGGNPHPHHVGGAALQARGHRLAGDRGCGGRGFDPASPCARSAGWTPDAGSGRVHAVPAHHQAEQ